MAGRPSLWAETGQTLHELRTTLELLLGDPAIPAAGRELALMQLDYAIACAHEAEAGVAQAGNLIKSARISTFTARRFRVPADGGTDRLVSENH